MNPEGPSHNQQQPNFDFITKQQDPAQHAHRKFSKKVILLFVLIGVTIIVLIVSWLVSAGDNVVEENSPEQISIQDAEAVIKDFLTQTADGNYDAAYQNVAVADETAVDSLPFTKDVFVTEGVPLLDTLKLKECTLAEENVAEGTVVFGCSSKEDDTVINLEFVVVKEGNATKIVYYRLGVSV